MRRLLLDSHVFVWWANRTPELRPNAIESIRKASEVFVSAATIWELSIKISKGKLLESRSLIALADEFSFTLLPVLPTHAEAVRTLKSHHLDPFDRLLLAQARTEQLVLVTHDRALLHYEAEILLV